MISKTRRWLDLIAFLVKHRFPVAVDQIMESVPAYEPKWTGDAAAAGLRARVRFAFPAALWVGRNGHGTLVGR